MVDLGIVRAFAIADDRVPLLSSSDPDNLTSSNAISPKPSLRDFEPLVFKTELPCSNRQVTRNPLHQRVGSDVSLTFSNVTGSPIGWFLSPHLAKISRFAILLFLVLSLVLMPIHYRFDRSPPLPSKPSYQSVSWFEDAATIEIGKMTITRIVLFGEVFDEEPH